MIRPLIRCCVRDSVFCSGSRSTRSRLKSASAVNVASGLSESKVASGLKQALQVGSENAVKSSASRTDISAIEAIKIGMPKDLHLLESGMREIGFGPKIDEFILSMNRSAEAAAPAARKIFIDAIFAMTFEDAKRILSGDNTAATQYFKEKTTGQLTDAFTPVVKKTMAKTASSSNTTRSPSNTKISRSQKARASISTTTSYRKPLTAFSTNSASRKNKSAPIPAARTTDLLKEVFSHAGH